MEYKISDTAKKVTLGIASIGFIFLVIGFFQQKDFVYSTKINDHSVKVTYNGHAGVDKQNELKEKMQSKMRGYNLTFHDVTHASQGEDPHASHGEDSHASHGEDQHAAHGEDPHASHGEDSHASHGEDSHASHGEDSHAHHGPTFIWDIHLSHVAHSDFHHGEHADSGADQLNNLINSGDIAFFDSGLRRFWSNLLVNGFFFFGISLGALFFLALHYATESGWAVVLLRVIEGVFSALPIGMVVLLIVFIVGTFGGHHIYHWMDPELTDPNSSHFDPIIFGKKAYLNIPFFWIRVVAYFLTFYLFLLWFKKKSKQEDSDGGTKTHFTMYRRAALFLVFFAVFSSTMAWDFIMSIDAHWFSTLFGWYVFSGIWLSGMIMVQLITLYLRKNGYLPFVKDSHIHDVGKWMFALSFLWSYLWFSQYMLIWYSNIPEEVIYYTERIANYKILFFGTFIVNFFFPMVFFMSADTKKSAGYLIVIGLLIFVGHWFDVFNMVMPGTLFDQWELGLLELGMFMLFLGFFTYTVLKSLTKSPLLQKNHPYLGESKHHEV